MLPNRIEEGIYLEDSGQLLPWGADIAQLVATTEAEQLRDRLRWRDVSILGGITATVDTLASAHLGSVVLWLAIDEGYRDATNNDGVIAVHRGGVVALAQTFGAPTSYSEGRGPSPRYSVYPYASWELPGFYVKRFVGDKNGITWKTEIERRNVVGR